MGARRPTTLSSFTGNAVSGFQSFEFLKAGQWLPWSPPVSKRLEKNLGKNVAYYRSAVACIRQSWGIGACAYMRRVIEEETGQILDLVERAAAAVDDQETIKNVIAARGRTAASERLEHASRRLPASLKPGNINPLARLFGAFSEGIHVLPEEKALETAENLRVSFVYLFENLRDQIDQAESFARQMNATGNPAHKDD